MKTLGLGLALVFVRVATVVAAGEPLRLTLDDALALMHRQSPEVLAARLRVRAAAGDVVTARLLPNPTLSTGVGNFALGETNPKGLSPKDTVVAQVGLTEELELWGRRGARIAQATEREAQAEAERSDLERRLTFELRSRFVGVMVESERLRLARENLDHYRETVRVAACIGFIALMGQVVLNGVVLVSQINTLRSEGMAVYAAVEAGSLRRLRAVLMTALLAALGLLPAALSTEIGSETQRPLAVVVIGGLVSATVLTLLVLPVLYTMLLGRRPTTSATTTRPPKRRLYAVARGEA
jgi:hypothetical protein